MIISQFGTYKDNYSATLVPADPNHTEWFLCQSCAEEVEVEDRAIPGDEAFFEALNRNNMQGVIRQLVSGAF